MATNAEVKTDVGPCPFSGWADARIAESYHRLERLSEAMPDGSTEGGLIREAMNKLELADQYVEQRQRDGETE